ncbi:hypothetical protein JTB14_036453 [Gonioctena quinquepunctata]|nr:hypothetical protein JTB14_036453 [Gonioctena quinquepunctata]
MREEYKDVIIKHFVTLMKECDVDVLAKLMVNKGVFTEKEKNEIFSTNDERHNKRVFFFKIQKKETRAFYILIDCLKETQQSSLADLLLPKRTGCKVFQKEQIFDVIPENIPDISSLNLHDDNSSIPLEVQVVPSNTFYDTDTYNKNIDFYNTRAKKRGRVLILNNIKFLNHKYRNGANVDHDNLKTLFNQMGGWDIEDYENKTAEEMEQILNTFSQNPTHVNYDIMFIIIMSHGDESANDTIIYGSDDKFLHALEVQNKFSNERCKSMRGKPKVFILSMCRGKNLDLTIQHDPNHFKTETDSISRMSESATSELFLQTLRSEEDVLVGYSTLLGFYSHRDYFRGSWYIEIMCEIFMNHAHDTAVDTLLSMIDNKLRKRMSEMQSMQTAELRNKGFKKLYLNPGIYCENGQVKKFHQ